MDSPLPRRLLSIPAVTVALPLLILLAPIGVTVGFGLDLLTGQWRFPTIRLWLFAIVFVAHEWIGLAEAARLWITGGFGRKVDYRRHQDIQGWWTTSLLRWAGRLLGLRLDLDDLSAIPEGDVLILSRHASMIDAIVPAFVFAGALQRPCHYVMNKELRWIPNIDVYGGRLGNHFIHRTGDRERQIQDIGRLAESAQPNSALVIFPEGTYATAEAKKRVQLSLERRQDHRSAALNTELSVLLPPRPAGTLALLDHRPDAPVVILGHVGLEGLAELSGLRRHLPAKRTVKVRWWTIERNEVPDDVAQRTDWLEDQWRSLDRWVAKELG